jgi:uncharacterized protein YcbX
MASMASVEQLIVYPIKSCAGIELEQATVAATGLSWHGIGDREWMVVRPDGGFLTQRECPRMALVRPLLAGATLMVHAPDLAPLALALAHDGPAPGTGPVQIWDDTVLALDCGDAAAAWFTQALATPCRLVRFDPRERRATGTRWTGGLEGSTLFADDYPILVVGSASLADLNARLVAAGRAPLPMNRFRPKVVLGALPAYEEDYTATVAAGTLALQLVKPCPRCPIPSIDQATGLPGPDPLDILASYRAKAILDGAICFGMNAIVAAGGGTVLRVGQTLDAAIAF